MVMDRNISVKGINDKLHISINSHDWSEGYQSLQDYLAENKKFLENAKVILDVKELILKSSDLFALRDLFNDYRVKITSIIASESETNVAINLLGIPNSTSEKTKPVSSKKGSLFQEESVVFHKTIRSGILISEKCTIVVIGDVNPGAVIKSEGSVIIWGRLFGEVHAGITGLGTANICALEMNPAVMSIANKFYEGKKQKSKEPETAYITDNTIRIENWKKITH